MNTIVYISDEGYIVPTCVSICSIVENQTYHERYCFLILCTNISSTTKERVRTLDIGNNELRFIDVPQTIIEEIEQINSVNPISGKISANTSALVKFYIPQLLGKDSMVLYLDGDIIVTDHIGELFKIDISDVCLAAAKDLTDETNLKEKKFRNDILKTSNYFNSGVMLLNLDKMRIDNIVERLKDYRRKNENHLMDQDAFNAVVSSSMKRISNVYNFYIPYAMPYTMNELDNILNIGLFDTMYECISRMKILHLIGKPWKVYNPRYSEIFLSYYSMTPFASDSLAFSYLIPYNQFARDDRIVLYGAGHIGKLCYRSIKETEYGNVVLWVDKNADSIHNEEVRKVNMIKQIEFDFLIIAILEKKVQEEVKSFLINDLQIKETKILIYNK